MDDVTLLERIAQRRVDAFEELYRRHAPVVASVAHHVCRDEHCAQEITQSTFLLLWTRARTLASRSGAVRAWLVVVARNAARDQLRRGSVRRRSVEVDVLDAPESQDDPAARVVVDERRSDIRLALAALREDQRVVIELAFFGGLSQSEIAAVLHTPLGTVKSRVRLAMQHLRSALHEHGGDSR